MDDPYITMEECIQLMADKGHRRDQEFNWETGTYGTVFRMPPYPFNYPTRSLTMEEILAKFIDEVNRVTTKGEKITSEATPSKGDKDLMLPKSKFNDDEPWYADFANYIVRKVVPPNWTFQKRKRFFSQVKTYFWEEPYAFKLCADNIIRRCVAGSEILEIQGHCHLRPTSRHHSSKVTAKIEHKAHWALKQCNMDLTLGSKSRLMQLNELAELSDGAYENTRIYKERTKKWHDSKIHGDKDFKEGEKVLLYNSYLNMYLGKLKSKWSGPNFVKTVYPHGELTGMGLAS
ncbi:hypothetical protein Tco_1451760, partial [Tanacetum coccineum]